MAGWVREHVIKRFGRSSGWRKRRNEHLKIQPTCAACGRKYGLQVHHVIPFHINPSLELDPKNLITLCNKHHILFGHLQNWRSVNIDVVMDCRQWLEKIKNRP